MKPGNSAAMGMNTGGSASGNIPETPCEELDKRNKSQRSQLANDPQSESVRGAFGPGGATTVAHGSLNGAAPLGAASRLLPSRYKHLAQGLWAETDKKKRRAMRKSRRSNLCPDPAFRYEKAARPHQSHCESKILETLFAPGGTPPSGTLRLNINWQSQDNPNSKLPCRACKKLLCHAQESCELDIELCQKDPKKPAQPLQC